ncbi:MAG: hypothetical protein ACRDRP_03135 [Pseudonocardiaceae bacterium]
MAVAETLPQVQQPTEPPEEQRWITSRMLLPFIIVVVANLAIAAMIFSSGDPASTATAPAQEQTPLAPVALPAPGAVNLATTFGEGRFVVGTDIAPGTYQTTGPSGNADCYWERLKHTSDVIDSIIANDLRPGPAMVTIDASDAVFQTRWCSTWTKVR